MANNFKLATFDGSLQSQNTFATVYTVPAGATSMVLGLSCSNLLPDTIFVDIKIIVVINIGKNKSLKPSKFL